ncbi:MAG: hypothetical protein JW945_02515 [Methanomicrobia archaeon]|nr:hypothetical protein [Methanomicrobia archaeon]
MVKKEEQIPEEKSYFKTPLGTLFPALGAVMCILLLLSLPPTTLALGIAALFLGSILYVLEDTPEGHLAVEEIRRLLNRPIDDASG